MSEPEDCLALLEQLNAAEARCLWPKGEPFKIIARASTASLNLSIKQAADWFSASGEVRFDEREALTLRQVFALLDENPGSRFLKMGESGFLALSSAFRRQLEDLRSLSSPAAGDAVRMHPLATLALDELIAEAQVDTDGPPGARSAASSNKPRPFRSRVAKHPAGGPSPLPTGGLRMAGTASASGARALAWPTTWVSARRCRPWPCCCSGLRTARRWWWRRRQWWLTGSMRPHRFAPTLNVAVYGGTAPSRGGQLESLGPFDLVVTSYGLLQNDIERLAEVPWRSAVLDEAQAIKNPATKRAKAARLLNADFRLITTGTPIQNNLIDLHSLFSFINPGLLGSLEHYRRHFASPIERGGERRRPQPAASPDRALYAAPPEGRRATTTLPERTEITLHVAMSSGEAALYEALRQRAVEDLETSAER